MRIKIVTNVKEQNISKIFVGFNKELFVKLAPPLPPVRLLRFDGCKENDIVQLEILLPFAPQRWDALITESVESEALIYFIDQGTRLPFFLKTWRHWHGIQQNPKGQGSQIIDDFEYTTPFGWLNYLMYPMLFLLFFYRKPIYKSAFK